MMQGFEFDHSFVRKRRHRDPEPESDWKFETPERRLEALEFLRKNHAPEQYAAETLQRVYRITRKKSG